MITKFSMKVRVLNVRATINKNGLSFAQLFWGYIFGRNLDEDYVLCVQYECDILEESRFTKEKMARLEKRRYEPASMDGMTGYPGQLHFDWPKKKCYYTVSTRLHRHGNTSPIPPVEDTYIWY